MHDRGVLKYGEFQGVQRAQLMAKIEMKYCIDCMIEVVRDETCACVECKLG